MTNRRPIIVGNWKMNLSGRDGLDAARRLVDSIATSSSDSPQLVVLPPFTALPLLQQLSSPAGSAQVEYGAQDLSPHGSGAYTGDIAGGMLAELGCRYVLAGHSERREQHGETDEVVQAKVRAALRSGLTPILCVGEGLDVRQAGRHLEHTLAQVEAALAGLEPSEVAGLLIAYEPVWAIGTGQVATPADAQEVCAAIRRRLADQYGAEIADRVRILYGGSVKAASSAEILDQPDVDGALVGGASLDPGELTAIWQSADRPRP